MTVMIGCSESPKIKPTFQCKQNYSVNVPVQPNGPWINTSLGRLPGLQSTKYAMILGKADDMKFLSFTSTITICCDLYHACFFLETDSRLNIEKSVQ